VLRGCHEISQLLLAAGARITLTTITLSIEAEKPDTFDMIWARWNSKQNLTSEEWQDLVISCCQFGNMTVLNTLLYHLPPSRVGCLRLSLGKAVRHDRQEMVKNLLAAGADIDEVDIDGQSALAIALRRKSTKAIETLIAAGASLNPKFECTVNGGGHDSSGSVLVAAIETGSIALVYRLIGAAIDINAPGRSRHLGSPRCLCKTALEAAFSEGNWPLADKLKELNASIEYHHLDPRFLPRHEQSNDRPQEPILSIRRNLLTVGAAFYVSDSELMARFSMQGPMIQLGGHLAPFVGCKSQLIPYLTALKNRSLHEVDFSSIHRTLDHAIYVEVPAAVCTARQCARAFTHNVYIFKFHYLCQLLSKSGKNEFNLFGKSLSFSS
jgi:hypothetical protein